MTVSAPVTANALPATGRAAPLRLVPSEPAPRASAVTPLKTQCSTCHLRDLCLPCGMTGNEPCAAARSNRAWRCGTAASR
jgi:hypothetical protein